MPQVRRPAFPFRADRGSAARPPLPRLLAAALLALAAAPLEARGPVISGRVLDGSGEHVKGARASLIATLPWIERAGALAENWQAGAPEIDSFLTGEDGRFSLEAPDQGFYEVRITAEASYYPLRHRLDGQPLIEDLRLPPATLLPATEVELTVAGTGGKSARIVSRPGTPRSARARRSWSRARQWIVRNDSGWQAASWRGVTDERGTAKLPAPSSGHELTLVILAPERTPRETFLTVEESGSKRRRPVRHEVKMQTGPRKTLQVLGVDGKPAANILVSAFREPLGRTDDRGRVQVRRGEEEVDIFLATESASARLALEPAPAKADPAAGAGQAHARQAAPDDAGPQVVELSPAVPIAGRVLDADTERPIAGALVWTGSGASGRSLTGRAGDYEVRVLTPEISRLGLSLRAAALGYVRSREYSSKLEPDAAGPTFSLAPSASLSGSLRDAAGEPVIDAVIRARTRRTRGPGSGPAGQILSGLSGAFRLTRVPAGETLELRIEARGFETLQHLVEPLESGEARAGLDLVLEPALVAVGRVLNEAEEPIAGATVSLSPHLEGGGVSSLLRQRAARYAEVGNEVTTDAEGAYRIENLNPGAFRLNASAKGFAPATVAGLEIARGEEARGPVDLGAVILVPGALFQGLVVDSRGSPVSGAGVSASENSLGSITRIFQGSRLETTTDAAGHFELQDLAKNASLSIELEKEGWVRARHRVQLPTDGLQRFEMERGGYLVGRVIDAADREPIGQAGVRVRIGGGGRLGEQRGRAEDDGSFRYGSFAAGSVSLEIAAEGYRSYARNDLEIVADRDTEVTVELERGLDLRGLVLDPSGQPVEQASIQVEPEVRTSMAWITPSDTSGADGRFTLRGLEPGGHVLRAEHEEWGSAVQRVEIPSGSAASPVELRFEGGSRVVGRVVDRASGEPVAEATVVLRRLSVRGLEQQRGQSVDRDSTNADGRFSLGPAKPGTYRVSATTEKRGSGASQPFEVARGADLEGVVLEIDGGLSIRGVIEGASFDEISNLIVQARSPGQGPHFVSPNFEGRFRLAELAAGTWRLEVSTQDGKTATESVELREGEGEPEVVLKLERGLEITGTVLRNGEPAAGATVSVRAGRRWIPPGQRPTDAEGRFKASIPEPGRFELWVQSRGSTRTRQTFDLAGGEDLVLEYRESTVTGRVLDAEGQPILGARIRSRAGEGEETATRTDTYGRYRLEALGFGAVEIVASRDGFAQKTRDLQLDGAALENVDFVLETNEGVRFRLLRADGSAPQRVELAVVDPASGAPALANRRLNTVQGEVDLSTLPPGDWLLRVAEPMGPTLEMPIRSPADLDSLTLPPGGVLTLELPDALDSGPGPMTLLIRDSAGRSHHRPLETAGQPREVPAGRPVRVGLPTGAWELELRSADGESWRRSFRIDPDLGTTVSLR
ncbi:MAG: carboxypeptidase regulatory-like domain-containing protein [Acidobacteriota bacterium]